MQGNIARKRYHALVGWWWGGGRSVGVDIGDGDGGDSGESCR